MMEEGGLLMVCGREKKIKREVPVPLSATPKEEKRRTRTWGVIASGSSGCRIAWHMGPFGGVSGTVRFAQCRTHRLYSHQGEAAPSLLLRHKKKRHVVGKVGRGAPTVPLGTQ